MGKKTIRIRAQRPGPNAMLYYTLDTLKKPVRRKDWEAWGVCEYDGNFWVGYEATVEGKGIRRLSLCEILDRKDEEYPEWEDEEIYLLVGVDGETGVLKWFLLNKEEFKFNEEHYRHCS